MRPIPAVSAIQFDVFSAAQALRTGWTESALRHAVRTDDLERLRPGVYAPALRGSGNRHADAITRARRAAAAVSVANRRVPASHASAAALIGLSLIDPPRRVCATFARGRLGDIPGVHLHRGRMTAGDVIALGRVLATSTARTVVDLGREVGTDAALAAADSALRDRLTTPHELAAALGRCARWPGVIAAARAVELADPRTESVLESLSRLRIAEAGLPAPDPQVTVLDGDGHFCGRVDFYWDEFGVVGEADGRGKYDAGPRTLIDEKARQGAVEDAGPIVVRWGWDDLDPFDRTAAKLRNAFARGLRPDRAPRTWRALPTPTWLPAAAAS